MYIRCDVYTADYIINVVTALRFFAPRDEPQRELANIPIGRQRRTLEAQRACVSARAYALLRLFSRFLAFETAGERCSQWRLCGATVTARALLRGDRAYLRYQLNCIE